MISEEKRLWAVECLRQKCQELGRLPRKDDFDDIARSRIKAFLGPWPRALEAAGLKKPSPRRSSVRKKQNKANIPPIRPLQKLECAQKQDKEKNDFTDTEK